VVGLDDWAWRRGQLYGTIIIDQERHVVLDLLASADPRIGSKVVRGAPRSGICQP